MPPTVSSPMMSPIRLPRYADEVVRSAVFRVSVDGHPVETLHATGADFASWTLAASDASHRVVIETDAPARGAFVRPLVRGVTPETEGGRLSFDLPGAATLCVEIPGLKTLFLYVNAPETHRPAPDAPGVRFFAAGQVHTPGELTLGNGETIYIEEGSVVKARLRVRGARGVRVAGRGVLDANFPGSVGQMAIFEDCEDVTVEDIVMIEPQSWMLVLGGCQDVRVHGLKQIGAVMCSDGIDVVGSRDVHIADCCLRNNDDCIVLKSKNITGDPARDAVWLRDVENVLVERCILWNAQCGNAMEIGFELSTERVSNIVFRDCDVLCVHGMGAVFSIHNGDRAVVEDVLWEDIRIEHFYDRLVDFRVLDSKYSQDRERGHIRRIRLRNVRAVYNEHNLGHSISLIGGYDAQHGVEDVTFEDVYLNDEKVLSADPVDLLTRHAERVIFR